MRVLILGVYGMLGHKLFISLGKRFDVLGTCRNIRHEWCEFLPAERLVSGVDAAHPETVRRAIEGIRPDVVINCIGIVKQIEDAKRFIPSIQINALFPHQLAEYCHDAAARLIHFSTDCVFSGTRGMYAPDDFSDAEDLYGRTKYLGEVRQDGCVTIRSSLIGRELDRGTGLVEWFLRQRGRHIKGYRNAIFSGFTTHEMGNIVTMLLCEHADLSGLLQAASEPISKYRLLTMMRDCMSLDIEIEADDDFICDRSLDGMDFLRCTTYAVPSWEAMIHQLVDEMGFYDRINSQLVRP